ncbi:HIT domain-containing protein [Motiliproteus sp. SC1-56]|uniref:HIT domain-containing protein n=1 Tax=Motiliproteus sp. SC1-56 TaxID=2799565 RepID=UPI001A8D6ADF|nr:HIT family protein [Motiliproteus sp. SC1-56]
MDDLELDDQAHLLDPELHRFGLDPQLAADTLLLGTFPLCDLLLMKDANYPWFILVPRRPDVTEIHHLGEEDQRMLMRESSVLSQNLADIFAAHKMNVAALGNVVRQLHIHHVVRYEGDPAWPAPVWGKHTAKPYSQDQIEEIRQRVCTLLEDRGQFQRAGDAKPVPESGK